MYKPLIVNKKKFIGLIFKALYPYQIKNFICGILAFLIISPQIINAQQNYDPFHILELKKSSLLIKNDLFKKTTKNNTDSTTYVLNEKELEKWAMHQGGLISTNLRLPGNKGANFIFTEYNFLERDFKIQEQSSDGIRLISPSIGKHFKAICSNSNNQQLSLSIIDGTISGYCLGLGSENYQIVSNKNSKGEIICNAIKIADIPESEYNFECHTDDHRHYIESKIQLNSRTEQNCKRVRISVLADYELYKKLGSNSQTVTTYILGLFNNLNTIFRRENILISLSSITINTTPDGMPTTNANAALDYFRRTFTNYNGDIYLGISGVSKYGKAYLGGIAYINALCITSYSYAYVNVNGTYNEFPYYSFDLYACAHELGHVMGSRHTHACVWGPNNNQALDNCYKVEGTCLPGPKPIKGSIMSYCHISTQPGIDLNLGFGNEPGTLIRKTINNAVCLSPYMPSSKTLESNDKHITANVECFDGVYTHYFFDNFTADPVDDLLLLSINSFGQNLGSINNGSLKIIEHTTENFGKGKSNIIEEAFTQDKRIYSANKFWEIISSAKLSKPLRIKFNVSEKDLEDISTDLPSFKSSDLYIYGIRPPGNPNPESKHINTTYQDFLPLSQGTLATNKSFLFSKQGIYYQAEIELDYIQSLCLGAITSKQELPTSLAKTSYLTLRARKFTGYQNITWTTASEENIEKYIVHRSTNGILFDSIGTIQAKGFSTISSSYSFNDFTNVTEAYYKIEAISFDKLELYSPVVSLTSSYNSSNRLNLYPNPVGYSNLTAEFNNTSESSGIITIKIYDPLQNLISSHQFQSEPGKNIFTIQTDQWFQPFYYVQLINGGESLTQKVVVKK